MHSFTEAVRLETLKESLCQSVLSILANPESAARRKNFEALIERIERERKGSPGSGEREAGQGHASAAVTRKDQLLHQAWPHRSAQLDAAASLVAKLGDDSSRPALTAETAPLIQTILAEEDAYRRAMGESMLQFEQQSVIRLDYLEFIEFSLFVVVMIVFLLEGIYVIGPAMNQIYAYVNNVRRSNEELKTYACAVGTKQQGAPRLRLGGLARLAGAVAESPGLQ